MDTRDAGFGHFFFLAFFMGSNNGKFVNTPITTLETFNKRARSKFLQTPLIEALIGLNGKFTKRYQETLVCAQIIQHQGDKLTARYCGRRWCRICNRIRTGKLINGYGPAIEAMPNQHFVTLTIPNVPAEELKDKMREMIKTLQKIQDLRRKQKRPGINSIRKLECTYNAERNDYHPHFHVITSTKAEGVYLLRNWLKRYPNSNVKAQDIRPATNPLELFKYFTKLTSKTNSCIGLELCLEMQEQFAFPEALDIIFQAIDGFRIIQPTGNVRLVKDDVSGIEAQDVDETVPPLKNRGEFYAWNGKNWASPFTNEQLSSYNPTIEIEEFRKKIRYLKPVPI